MTTATTYGRTIPEWLDFDKIVSPAQRNAVNELIVDLETQLEPLVVDFCRRAVPLLREVNGDSDRACEGLAQLVEDNRTSGDIDEGLSQLFYALSGTDGLYNTLARLATTLRNAADYKEPAGED